MPDLMSDSSPRTGELLDGRYLLDARIGAGGMAVVYRARDEALGRMVAVKLFRESAGDASDIARTTSETTLLAALNHHSLVTLFDAKVDSSDAMYLVMEYVDGPTLRERITEGPIPAREVAVMAEDLGEALHVVHQAGVVHRDIKPSNVLLRRSELPSREFRAKLADFGIAYLIDSTRVTTPGTLIGTAAYLSPEQVRGAEPAPASDIYALGLVLLEALTGERAFPQTGTHEAALARLSHDPVIPGNIGYPWRSLLTAMTSRDPDQRPTALDVALAVPGLGLVDAAPDETGRLDETGPTTSTGTGPTQVMRAPAADPPSRPAARHADTVNLSRSSLTRPADELATAVMRLPARVRRWHIVVAVLAVFVIAAIVGVLIWGLGQSSGAVSPTLPPLDDPLASHMRQLLDTVTP